MELQRASVESVNLGMDTVMTHRAVGRHAAEAVRAVKREAARLEGMLSRFMPESEITAVNQSAGHACCNISPETFDVLSCSVELSSACQGLFDVTTVCRQLSRTSEATLRPWARDRTEPPGALGYSIPDSLTR